MDKQHDIIAAALKLFVEYGFHGTPTSKIAKEAGVANGTLFHYYKTKEDLIVSLYIDIKLKMACHAEAIIATETDFKTRLEKQFVAVLYWAMQHDDEFRYLQQFYSSPFVAKIKSEALLEITAKNCGEFMNAIQSNTIKKMPVDYIMTLLTSHTFGLHQYLRTAALDEAEKKKMIQYTFDLLWNMLT